MPATVAPVISPLAPMLVTVIVALLAVSPPKSEPGMLIV